MKNQQINETRLDLDEGSGWRIAGKLFIGLDVLCGILDMISDYDVDPLLYLPPVAVGIGSYYVGHSKRSHQVKLYIASQLEKIAKNYQKD